jgi:hypothetical protein
MNRHARRLALATAAPRPEPPIDPAATLLDRIAVGELDPHLTALAEAIRARFDLLHRLRPQTRRPLHQRRDPLPAPRPRPAAARSRRRLKRTW